MSHGAGVRRALRSLSVLVLTSVLTVSVMAALGGPAEARPERARPILNERGFADPSVVAYPGGFLAVATGINAPRATSRSPVGPWQSAGRTLARLPGWAASRKIWASDLVRAGGRWLLYYSAPVRGLGPGGRCIGVASSSRALGRFRPTSRRPLVCPRGAHTPRASDRVRSRRHSRPHSGVIDPSGFRDDDGRRYLLYKTQGGTSAIRLLRLTSGGARVMPGARSHELLRKRGVIENPVLIRHGRHLVLLTSEGYFGGCGYRTTWRESTHIRRWAHSRRHLLFRRTHTGVCGPGGADVVETRGRHPLVYFHGWTCWRTNTACPSGRDLDRNRQLKPQRSMFGGHLRWHHGRPRVLFLRR